MKKVLFVSVIMMFFLSGCTGGERSGVEILSNPAAKVYINGKEAGNTPYRNKNVAPGFTKIKLAWGNDESKVWEQGIKLLPFTDAVVDVALENGEVSGYILSLEPNGQKEKAGLILASYPDNALVVMDESVMGYAPMRASIAEIGDKHVKLILPGYKNLDVYAKMVAGYELSLIGFLSKEEVVTRVTEPKISSIAEVKRVIVVKNTPVGFLRVRSEANTTSAEIAKIKTGEKYEIVSENEGWIMIKLNNGSTGWVKREFSDISSISSQ